MTATGYSPTSDRGESDLKAASYADTKHNIQHEEYFFRDYKIQIPNHKQYRIQVIGRLNTLYELNWGNQTTHPSSFMRSILAIRDPEFHFFMWKSTFRPATWGHKIKRSKNVFTSLFLISYICAIYPLPQSWCKMSHLQELDRLTGLVWAHSRNVVFQNSPDIQFEFLGLGSKLLLSNGNETKIFFTWSPSQWVWPGPQCCWRAGLQAHLHQWSFKIIYHNSLCIFTFVQNHIFTGKKTIFHSHCNC